MNDFFLYGVSLDNLMKRFKGDSYRVPNGNFTDCLMYEDGQKNISEAKYNKAFEAVKSLLVKNLIAYNKKNKKSPLKEYEDKLNQSQSAHEISGLIQEMLVMFHSN
jgi:hypothetical protein